MSSQARVTLDPQPADPQPAGRRLRIASYNVHGCVGSDGRRDVLRIAEVIRQLDADIVGLQEVDGRERAGMDQLHALARETGLTAVAGPTIRTGQGDYGNALLTRLGVLASTLIDLSFEGREPRGLLDVKLDVGVDHARVIVTHFGLRRRERAEQARALVRQLGEHKDAVVVVMGDVNEWWPWANTLRCIDDHIGCCPRLRTFPSTLPLLALDRMWVNPPRAVLRFGVTRDPLTRVASDHLPLVADVELSPMTASSLGLGVLS
jgi:endonuclease/exonuclease/phosphatase family metal-dependent hydrolase